ncbi:hypothetical protein E3P92_01096 [Wallemia ichthyophaga]|uniref:RlpA-like protein double-psi beta-barrel domain-containing protein n=2 Tax=Wallemia ichthyophaga TaxID=245174 RepID=R9AEW6_WALI9|nr:uncharacterized protein J056_002068 [Wallemia ichthyophaga EXF-994]XP_009266208.1 uncharacterized protein J056_002069 [Wallemia ichthyophaga EXF-994]XP_009270534.1 uncharacterized protein J056_004641 [Wallemia ichthyophaga EXF-994]TIA74662.1 hypothetical protein E3P91_00803 [Wallemia ichthyophaga]EOQ98625.1 hypothetical protein J056_004641 [Wallemia ichthyophaga EXF-994]EOR03990.1 hypothetical protein J056_002068 [Wallemia ichthyophaga EXF-994]EOR03991.1 hypothetical protein J056_002069 [W
MNFKAIALASLAALVAAAPTNEQPVNETAPVSKRSDDTYNNIATWYNAETGNRGACGDWLSNNDRFVAVSYDNPIPCGQWVGFNVNGVTSYGKVVDKCPSCAWNHYDMSLALFQDFDQLYKGEIYDIWSWHVDSWVDPSTLF